MKFDLLYSGYKSNALPLLQTERYEQNSKDSGSSPALIVRTKVSLLILFTCPAKNSKSTTNAFSLNSTRFIISKNSDIRHDIYKNGSK